MSEQFRGEVLYTLSPEELAEQEATAELQALATDPSRYVLVCRRGGRPSWVERVWAFLRRDPVAAVTIVSDDDVAVGETISVPVTETEISGVYSAQTAPDIE
ncbi:DUF7526 family protein [Haloplanus sp. C73]|uniref:DUF7526 family protein n=1 Tax=Haloplanus sp. C73 TaxID=3421641 RepID=UPI003EBD94F8